MATGRKHRCVEDCCVVRQARRTTNCVPTKQLETTRNLQAVHLPLAHASSSILGPREIPRGTQLPRLVALTTTRIRHKKKGGVLKPGFKFSAHSVCTSPTTSPSQVELRAVAPLRGCASSHVGGCWMLFLSSTAAFDLSDACCCIPPEAVRQRPVLPGMPHHLSTTSFRCRTAASCLIGHRSHRRRWDCAGTTEVPGVLAGNNRLVEFCSIEETTKKRSKNHHGPNL